MISFWMMVLPVIIVLSIAIVVFVAVQSWNAPPPRQDEKVGRCYQIIGYSGKAGYIYSEIPCPTA